MNDLSVNCLSTVCRQQLCALLDPPEAHGKDWCLLAVQLGLQDKIATIEASPGSHTAAMLDMWAADQSSLGMHAIMYELCGLLICIFLVW